MVADSLPLIISELWMIFFLDHFHNLVFPFVFCCFFLFSWFIQALCFVLMMVRAIESLLQLLTTLRHWLRCLLYEQLLTAQKLTAGETCQPPT